MLKKCSWDGEDVNCSSIFRTVPTAEGMCCAFNAEDALKQSSYSDLVMEMRSRSGKSERVNMENAKAGKKRGLRVVLDLHSNVNAFGTVYDDFNGFKVSVGEPAEFPQMQERSLHMPSGFEHFIDISADDLIADENVRDEKSVDRQCLFKHENTLEYYKNYTYSTCKFECKIKLADAAVSCTPWFLPQGTNTTACDPWQARNFMQIIHSIEEEECGHCLSDCEVTIYNVDQSSTPFRQSMRLI